MNRPLLRPGILLATVEDGYVAYDTASDQLHHLNPTSALIIELCDGTRGLDEIRQTLSPMLKASGWEACSAWIDSAVGEGLLTTDPTDLSDQENITAEKLTELASRLRERGRLLPAFMCQKQASIKAPDESHIWYQLGELAHIVSRRDEAREAYKRYLELHGDDAEVEHILISLRDESPPQRASDRCIEQLYSRFASFYEENMCGELDFQAPDRLADALLSGLGDRSQLNILDLGCGTGLLGRLIRERAHRLVGIDLSPDMIERAQEQKSYDTLETAEITSWLEKGDDQYDVIAASDSMIYFGDLRQVVLPAVRRLAPGGMIALTVEKGDVFPFRLSDSGRYTHHRDHLIEVAKEAGLSISHLEESVLRIEYGEQVVGWVVCLQASRVTGAEFSTVASRVSY